MFGPPPFSTRNSPSPAVFVFVSLGADVRVRSNTGMTALSSAARSGNMTLVRLLMTHGAEVRSLNKQLEKSSLEPDAAGTASTKWFENPRIRETVLRSATLSAPLPWVA